MNKRLMQFLSDLAEENDCLQKDVESQQVHIRILIETNKELRKTVGEWKAKVRKLKKGTK